MNNGYWYLIDEPSPPYPLPHSRVGGRTRRHKHFAQSFEGLRLALRKYFREEPKLPYVDVTRLGSRGLRTSYSRRYFRNLSYKTF